jgi:hypothetical protein
MEERVKKRAALCMLITLVDNNNGSINIGTDTVKRVFNDEDEVVKIEYANGVVALAADADYDTINNAVLKWKEDNPQIFRLIMDGLSNKDSN